MVASFTAEVELSSSKTADIPEIHRYPCEVHLQRGCKSSVIEIENVGTYKKDVFVKNQTIQA